MIAGSLRDGYELFLRQLLDNHLSIQTAGIVKISFEEDDSHCVCLVSVAASGKTVFAKPSEGGKSSTDFWVRIGSATKQLRGDDTVQYHANNWG